MDIERLKALKVKEYDSFALSTIEKIGTIIQNNCQIKSDININGIVIGIGDIPYEVTREIKKSKEDSEQILFTRLVLTRAQENSRDCIVIRFNNLVPKHKGNIVYISTDQNGSFIEYSANNEKAEKSINEFVKQFEHDLAKTKK
jgi:hypothetical protein